MLEDILKLVVQYKAPDVHLKVGQSPIFRLPNGDLFAVEGSQVLDAASIEDIAKKITSESAYAKFKQNKQVDCAYSLSGVGRFRVNVYQEKDGAAIAFRLIPENIPSFDKLGIPEVVAKMAMRPRGLLLVTGPTGSGKSTTLASLVDFINEQKRSHIITIEDPIEYVHKSKKSLVTQREIGVHADSFVDAIKACLRQDPNVIMVGEMRDLETIAATLTLAETGHLVLATLHTHNAAQTIDRIVDVFPPYQQNQVRMQLSMSLNGVISQQLLPKKDGGRIAAREIMINTPAVANIIRENKIPQIKTAIQTSAEDGMVTLEQDLKRLLKDKLVEKEMVEYYLQTLPKI